MGMQVIPHRMISMHWRLCAAIALCSVLLSLWAWHADPIINNDGTQYVRAASYFIDGQWQQGFEVYKWPFYSLVSAFVAKVAGLTAAHAAYTVNAGLYILLLWGFLACVWSLGGDRRVLVIGAIIVLLHPTLNEHRSYIIRDIGYWAFYLWGLAYFFHYLLEGRHQSLGLWGLCAIVATLFRIEGLVFLLLLPVVVRVGRLTGVRRQVSVGTGMALAVALLGSAVMWQYIPESGVSLSDVIGAPVDHLVAGWIEVGQGIEAKLDALSREFPGQMPVYLGWPVFLITLTWLVLDKIVRATSLVYTVLAACALIGNRIFPRFQLTGYWWAIISFHLVYLYEFTFINFFLTDRYPIALGLTLLACVPFGLKRLLCLWRNSQPGQRIRWIVPVLTVFIVAAGAEGIAITTNKHYLKQAGVWLQTNMQSKSELYSNERRVIYYAGKDSAFRAGANYSWQEVLHEIWSGRWRQYDYLALNVSHGEPEHARYVKFKLKREPVKIFKNGDGDQVLVFRIRARE